MMFANELLLRAESGVRYGTHLIAEARTRVLVPRSFRRAVGLMACEQLGFALHALVALERQTDRLQVAA